RMSRGDPEDHGEERCLPGVAVPDTVHPMEKAPPGGRVLADRPGCRHQLGIRWCPRSVPPCWGLTRTGPSKEMGMPAREGVQYMRDIQPAAAIVRQMMAEAWHHLASERH